MTKLSAVVLTKDSEKYLDKCLDSLSFVSELIIVDDDSKDSTKNIAKRYTNNIAEHSLGNDFSEQRNFGLKLAKNDWVLFVDSDEVVSQDLSQEIISVVNSEEGKNGFYLPREDVIWGKKLRHGDNKTYLLRLGRKDKGIWAGDVHEVWNIKGEVGRLGSSIFHYPHQTTREFLSEINIYSSIRAKELFSKKVRANVLEIIFYPLGKFLNIFFVKFGFLDGLEGLVSALMMSFYSFLVRAKLWELYEKEKGRKRT